MRCGCAGAGECACALDGDGIAIEGIGSAKDPYLLSLDVATGVNDCVALTGDGTRKKPLTAAPIISDAKGNGLKCTKKGLFAPGGVVVAEAGKADCIALSGAGTAEDPLIAAPVLDPVPDNALKCGPAGLYVPGGQSEESESEESGTPAVRSVRYVDLWAEGCQKIGGGAKYHLVRFPYDGDHDDDPYGWHEPDNHPDGHRVDPKKWKEDGRSALVYPGLSGWCQIWMNVHLAAGDYTEVRVQICRDPYGDADPTGTNHVTAGPGGQFFTLSWATRVTKGVPLALRIAHNGKKEVCLDEAQFKFTVQP